MVPILGTYGYILLLGLLAISIYDYYLHVSMIIKSPPPSPPTHFLFWQRTNWVERSWWAGELRNLFKPNFIINYFTQLHALINIWWKSQTIKWYILIMTLLNSVKNDKDIYIYTWEGLFITAFLIASGTLVSISSSYTYTTTEADKDQTLINLF